MMAVQTPIDKYFTGLKHCKSNYIPFYLTLMLFSAIIIKNSFVFSSFSPFLPLIILFTTFGIFLVLYQPYKYGTDNISIIFQIITLIYFLGWSSLKEYELISQDEATEVFLFLLLMIMMLILMITTVIRIVLSLKRTLKSFNCLKPNQKL